MWSAEFNRILHRPVGEGLLFQIPCQVTNYEDARNRSLWRLNSVNSQVT